MPRLNQKLT